MLTVDWLHSPVFVLFVCLLTPTLLPLSTSLPHLPTSTSFFLYDSPPGSCSRTLPPHFVPLISPSSRRPHLVDLISSFPPPLPPSQPPHLLPSRPPHLLPSRPPHLLGISSLSRLPHFSPSRPPLRSTFLTLKKETLPACKQVYFSGCHWHSRSSSLAHTVNSGVFCAYEEVCIFPHQQADNPSTQTVVQGSSNICLVAYRHCCLGCKFLHTLMSWCNMTHNALFFPYLH